MGVNIFICIPVLFLLYLILQIILDSNRFHVVTYHIKTGKLLKPVRFAFLSDLHEKQYGPQNEKLLKAIEDMKPDAVLVGGDMITAHPGCDTEGVLAFLQKLTDKYPVYYGSGNHEQRLFLYPERFGDTSQVYEAALERIGVKRLKNQTTGLGEFPIDIASVQIKRTFYKRRRHISMSLEDMCKRIKMPEQDGRIKLLLAHNPDYFETYRQWGADVVLSGHVHGGIIRLPLLGGVISPRVTLFPKYDGGRFDEDGSTMIISRGLGSHTIPLRLWNPGELVEIIIE